MVFVATAFTPDMKQRTIEVNSEPQNLTTRHLKAEFEEFNVNTSKSQLQQWLNTTGAKPVRQRIKPMLSFHHRRERMDFILDQATRGNKWLNGRLVKVHVDEAHFYLSSKRGKGCAYSPERGW